MRLSFALLLLLPSAAVAQVTDDARAATKWVLDREVASGGFALSEKDTKPGLRATNGATRALRYLGAEVPSKAKHAAFVLSCYDPATGAFAEPGGKADVTITAVGVLAAAELGVPHDKFPKAMAYLKANAKTFEDVRIGAAAVEAWGVKECPFKLDDWFEIAYDFGSQPAGKPEDGGARAAGSVTAFVLRLGEKLPEGHDVLSMLKPGQRPDGGWGKKGEAASDIETTYRVMRALYLLKAKPTDVAKLRDFVGKHRTADGGYGVKPGEASSMSGAYYAAILGVWAKDSEKK